MPDVSIDNTIVQEDLSSGESVTVPSGESWDVTLIASTSGALLRINAFAVVDTDSNTVASESVDIVVHDGDTIKSDNGVSRVRGWVVRS